MPWPWFAGQVITADDLNRSRTRQVVQAANQEVESSTTLVPTEVSIPVEAGATYWVYTVIAYSAASTQVTGAGGLRWSWDVPTGTAMPRVTAAYSLEDPDNDEDLNTGGNVILRSPSASTEMRAEGTHVDNFNSVHENAILQVGGASGTATLQFAQWSSSSTPTILRGILRTRSFYTRVQ
ncbi:hypothetical protein FHX37_0505 [Haloactinospora alba]|uniref:Uncharacterized protein n=1 Tax=Haloactinospora alba TaxID=405555 RepID=A0A543NFK6_9ACTN|nr:hypothetical protein [Haloactinospora alba]TQN30623.1 hypothetical protein FHX37_0505 [Haloactinospora alba]